MRRSSSRSTPGSIGGSIKSVDTENQDPAKSQKKSRRKGVSGRLASFRKRKGENEEQRKKEVGNECLKLNPELKLSKFPLVDFKRSYKSTEKATCNSSVKSTSSSVARGRLTKFMPLGDLKQSYKSTEKATCDSSVKSTSSSVGRGRLTRFIKDKNSRANKTLSQKSYTRTNKDTICPKVLRVRIREISAGFDVLAKHEIQAAMQIQSATRIFLRNNNVFQSNHAKKIQALWRGYHDRMVVEIRQEKATFIQSKWKMCYIRRSYLQYRYCIAIQSAWRCRYARKNYLQYQENKKASTLIQTAWRSFFHFYSYIFTLHRIIMIQKTYRGRIGRKIYDELYQRKQRRQLIKDSATTIQRFIRGINARRQCLNVRERNWLDGQVSIIQAAWRGYHAQQNYSLALIAANKIQAFARGFSQQIRYLDCLWSTVVIQSHFRRWMAKAKFMEAYTVYFENKAASTIQACWHRMIARENYMSLRSVRLIQQTWRTYCGHKNFILFQAAQKIQAEWRCYAAHVKYIFTIRANHAAIKIQSKWRTFMCHSDYIFTLIDLITVQRLVRGIAGRKVYKLKIKSREKLKEAEELRQSSALIIQRVFRGYLGCIEFDEAWERKEHHDAAIIIQKEWRQYDAEQNFWQTIDGVIRIQSLVRSVFAKYTFYDRLGNIILLQSVVRRYIATRKLERLCLVEIIYKKGRRQKSRHKKAAKKLQSFYWKVVKPVLVVNCVIKIQGFFRMVKAMVDVQIILEMKQLKEEEEEKFLEERLRNRDPTFEDSILEEAWDDSSNAELFQETLENISIQEPSNHRSNSRSRLARRRARSHTGRNLPPVTPPRLPPCPMSEGREKRSRRRKLSNIRFDGKPESRNISTKKTNQMELEVDKDNKKSQLQRGRSPTPVLNVGEKCVLDIVCDTMQQESTSHGSSNREREHGTKLEHDEVPNIRRKMRSESMDIILGREENYDNESVASLTSSIASNERNSINGSASSQQAWEFMYGQSNNLKNLGLPLKIKAKKDKSKRCHFKDPPEKGKIDGQEKKSEVILEKNTIIQEMDLENKRCETQEVGKPSRRRSQSISKTSSTMLKEPLKTRLRGVSKEPLKTRSRGESKEPSNICSGSLLKEPLMNLSRSVSKEPLKHHFGSKEPSKNRPRSASKERSKNRSRSTSKEPSKNRSRSASKEPSKNHSRSASKEPSKNRSLSASKEPSKYRSRSSSKEPSMNRSRSASKEPSKNRSRRVSKEPSKGRSRSTSKEPSKNRSRNTSKEPAAPRSLSVSKDLLMNVVRSSSLDRIGSRSRSEMKDSTGSQSCDRSIEPLSNGSYIERDASSLSPSRIGSSKKYHNSPLKRQLIPPHTPSEIATKFLRQASVKALGENVKSSETLVDIHCNKYTKTTEKLSVNTLKNRFRMRSASPRKEVASSTKLKTKTDDFMDRPRTRSCSPYNTQNMMNKSPMMIISRIPVESSTRKLSNDNLKIESSKPIKYFGNSIDNLPTDYSANVITPSTSTDYSAPSIPSSKSSSHENSAESSLKESTRISTPPPPPPPSAKMEKSRSRADAFLKLKQTTRIPSNLPPSNNTRGRSRSRVEGLQSNMVKDTSTKSHNNSKVRLTKKNLDMIGTIDIMPELELD